MHLSLAKQILSQYSAVRWSLSTLQPIFAMSTTSPPPDLDTSMPTPPPPPDATAAFTAAGEPEERPEQQEQEPKYGGFTRFEIELEVHSQTLQLCQSISQANPTQKTVRP